MRARRTPVPEPLLEAGEGVEPPTGNFKGFPPGPPAPPCWCPLTVTIRLCPLEGRVSWPLEEGGVCRHLTIT